MCSTMDNIISLDRTTVTIFAVTFLLCYWLLRKRRSNLPPGPPGLPIIGNLLLFRTLNHNKIRLSDGMLEESKKYGDVICLTVLRQTFVFLHGYRTIREWFVKNSDLVSSRPHWHPNLAEGTKEGRGVIWQSGQEWMLARKFTLQALKDFGVGKTSLEQKILIEIDAVTKYFAKMAGNSIDIKLLTSMMITNVMYGIVFAKRFDYSSDELLTIIHQLDAIFQQGGSFTSGTMPYFLLKLINRKEYDIKMGRLDSIRWVKSHIHEEIRRHEDTFDIENIGDFIDLYLQAKSHDSSKTVYNAGNLFRIIMDLFIAGSETTSNTINWCLLYMQEFPEVQSKCQEEIYEKCGDKQVSWSDRNNLPFVEATLLEIQRLANVAPMSVAHTNNEDVTIDGYHIPKHTLIFANLYSSNMDPKYWDQPNIFKPERFISNGQVTANPAFIPFSIGPRVCLGEPLAKMEMFLIFTNLLQRFTFKRPDDTVKHSFKCIPNQLTSAPLPYRTKVIKRY